MYNQSSSKCLINAIEVFLDSNVTQINDGSNCLNRAKNKGGNELKIKFMNVGNQKLSWTADIKTLTSDVLVRQIARKGALYNPTIDFQFNEETQEGKVLIAVVGVVGEFKVIGVEND